MAMYYMYPYLWVPICSDTDLISITRIYMYLSSWLERGYMYTFGRIYDQVDSSVHLPIIAAKSGQRCCHRGDISRELMSPSPDSCPHSLILLTPAMSGYGHSPESSYARSRNPCACFPIPCRYRCRWPTDTFLIKTLQA